ncbi:MAG: hypothetical protein KDC34_18000 [Saprospiraceae bacterium]|nr:hypothetical protein [Saprospiraceae bacterium]
MAYTGTETSRTVAIANGTTTFTFTKAQLDQLLNNNPLSPDVVGIRFHFKRSGTQVGEVIAIGVVEDEAEVQRPTEAHYVKSDNMGSLKTTELPSWISQDDKIASPSSSEGICAYLSKEVLNRDILSGAVNPSDLIQVFIVDADISPLGNGTLITRTLAAKGPGFSAMPKLSQLPCPPHCGGDYIGRNF